MSTTLNVKRLKATIYDDVNFTTTAAAVVETDTSTSETKFWKDNLASTTPPTFTVASVVTTNGSPTITVTNAGFANVVVGDGVSGTGIPASTTVLAKASDNSITLSANATAGGTITATITPVAITPAFVGVELVYTRPDPANPNLVTVGVNLHSYDGSLQGTAGTTANSSKIYALTTADGKPIVIDTDAFLTKIRVPRA
jgi:hypothetical protein